MAERHREYKPAKRLTTQEKLEPILNLIYEAKASNISDRTLAAKLGWDLAQFTTNLHEYTYLKEKPLLLAYEAGCATFEWENTMALDEIINDPEVGKGTKAKYLLERLKRLEQWAPATRAVRVQVEDTRTVLEFESLSEEEQQEIINKNNTDNDESSKEED